MNTVLSPVTTGSVIPQMSPIIVQMEGSQGRPMFDFPGREKSEAWIHFGFYKNELTNKIDRTYAICKHCRKPYKNNGKF